MTLIYFILILGITVFVHEFGHFMWAKKFGVYVYEFSIGMGPRIFKFNRKNDETDYCIRLLPIGGFVQMAGEEVEVDEKIPVNQRLMNKPAYQRFIIMVAGVTMNFITAFILLFFLGLFNKVSIDNVYVANSIIPNLNDGDKIVAINDRFVNNYDKLALEITLAQNKDYVMTVKDKDGNKKKITVNPVAIGKSNLIFEKSYGFEVEGLEISNSTIDGITKGDTILKVNDKEISGYLELVNVLNNLDDSFTLTTLNKDNEAVSNEISVSKNDKDELLGYSYGYYIEGKEAKGLLGAIKYAFLKFFSTIEQMIFTVLYLITGKISLNMLSGPVGIYNVVGIYSQAGFSSLVSLLCLICINVGFINLLPLPAFDGGHVLFIIIEKIKGSKVDPKVENIIHTVGFVLLMILMVLITYNDIIKLF